MAETEQPPVQPVVEAAVETSEVVAAEAPEAAAPAAAPEAKTEELEPLEDILRRRVTVIKEGDNVLLKLPSDAIKAVVASKDG